MLVEINLLPKKEPKNRTLFLLLLPVIFILLVGLGLTYFISHSLDKQMKTVEKQTTTTEQLVTLQQQKMAEFEESNSLKSLESAVDWAKDYPVKTVPVMRHLISLLPERGFIQAFSYEENEEIKLVVQFDTSRESAYYLSSLLDSNWIKLAVIESVISLESLTNPEGETTINMDESEEEELLPRYLGTYRIILNKEEINAVSQNNESSNEQGGEDS